MPRRKKIEDFPEGIPPDVPSEVPPSEGAPTDIEVGEPKGAPDFFKQFEGAIPDAIKAYAKSRGISIIEALHEITQQYYRYQAFKDLRGDHMLMCLDIFKQIGDNFLMPYYEKRSQLMVKETIDINKELLQGLASLLAEAEVLKQRFSIVQNVGEVGKKEVEEREKREPQQKSREDIMDVAIRSVLYNLILGLSNEIIEEAKKRGYSQELASAILDVVLSTLKAASAEKAG